MSDTKHSPSVAVNAIVINFLPPIARYVIENEKRKEENKIKYEILSNELGIKINTRNQYELYLCGAPNEIIETDIPVYLYKMSLDSNTNTLLLPKNL